MDIRAYTDAEEQAILRSEVEALLIKVVNLKQEKSTAGELKLEKCVKRAGQNNTGYLYGFLFLKENGLETDLVDFDAYFVGHHAANFKPIIAKTWNIVGVTCTSAGLMGSLSYKISDENLRLVIYFETASKTYRIAFAPDWHPMTNRTFEGSTLHSGSMTDNRWWKATSEPTTVTIRHQSILASVVSCTAGKMATMKIWIVKKPIINLERSIGHAKSASSINLVDGKTIRGKSISNCLEYVLESYGYVVDISNFLNESLSDAKFALESGQPFGKLDVVHSGHREVLIVRTDFCGKSRGGLVSFRIVGTDLRLAVAFQLFNHGNKFALGFFPTHVAISTDLILVMTSDNQWINCMDHKFASAKDGEQVIETRNIQASASMTDDMKAVVKVAIKTI